MNGFCDLHTHSLYSDGTFPPEALIRLADDLGLDAVALTDHNTIDGLPEFLAAAEKARVEAVPGIEFSSEFEEKELHILALFTTPEQYPRIREWVANFHRCKEESNRALVEALSRAGMVIDYETIRREAKGSINRACIAAAMVEKGYIASIDEGFDGCLAPGNGFYVPPKRPDSVETVAFIHSLGAIPVLAHPFLSLDEAALRRFLTLAKPAGLVGMEVFYPKYSPETTALSAKIAEEFDLEFSGGSDFHGENKPKIRLGTGTGALQVSTEYLRRLKRHLNSDR